MAGEPIGNLVPIGVNQNLNIKKVIEAIPIEELQKFIETEDKVFLPKTIKWYIKRITQLPNPQESLQKLRDGSLKIPYTPPFSCVKLRALEEVYTKRDMVVPHNGMIGKKQLMYEVIFKGRKYEA